MLRLSDRIFIDCPVEPVYALASDIERHAKILPGYIESRIVERRGDVHVVQREAMIHGKLLRWKSDVWFEKGKAIHFRQSEGPFKGMRVEWRFENNSTGSQLEIIHELILRPRWRGWWVERWVAKPAIEKTARLVLEAIKKVSEQEILEEVVV